MRRARRVKIVATLGPAYTTQESIERLFVAGADVFRINMSHANYDLVRAQHTAIRGLETKYSRPIAILADLQGPKLRVGEIGGERVEVKTGAIFVFDQVKTPGNAERVYLPHPPIFQAVAPGHTLLLDDGKLRMRVESKTDNAIRTKVEVGGTLASRKGISLPDSLLPLGALTDKDKADLDFVVKLGVDWLALSFVQRWEDVAEAAKLVDKRCAIMAKIEKPAALTDLDHIIELSDGIMVARGDLGVELPVQKVPGLPALRARRVMRFCKPGTF